MKELSFYCDAFYVDFLSDAFMHFDALSVSIEDADADSLSEEPIFLEPGFSTDKFHWSRNKVTILIKEKVNPIETLDSVLDYLGMSDKNIDCVSIVDLKELDWVSLVQSEQYPIFVTERICIITSQNYITSININNTLSNIYYIEINPGLAFGTGSHPTTSLCLSWLDSNIRNGESVLDYGCGSGILAITSLKLGAGRVVAVDIDNQAISCAKSNAIKNNVDLIVCNPEDMPVDTYEIVIANILSKPLQLMANKLSSMVQQNGYLVLSGILSNQVKDVILAYSSYIKLQVWKEVDGWVCLYGKNFIK
ncbi:ribosomal protein L11 methyltransferase [Candidatus Kinetoplastibacterium oncopeltii TCC290E]|uniref:Ribosomal protein L11 methyltransferase n=1 Tax=Candidatus Kinetoplastidibacterium stringomonadis TCC290E TaxID=1208920 RepID=M1LZR1_9PROT|nr:50S ribosomal protein L11 methyltransferase [Candidatus Kinetoplastibacterium oncopeltii]AGF48594.1 ribosomal protein L11 methyltransferase [Candidatus Kinetoplastibacterium oncopeltii TCC290E]